MYTSGHIILLQVMNTNNELVCLFVVFCVLFTHIYYLQLTFLDRLGCGVRAHDGFRYESV